MLLLRLVIFLLLTVHEMSPSVKTRIRSLKRKITGKKEVPKKLPWTKPEIETWKHKRIRVGVRGYLAAFDNAYTAKIATHNFLIDFAELLVHNRECLNAELMRELENVEPDGTHDTVYTEQRRNSAFQNLARIITAICAQIVHYRSTANRELSPVERKTMNSALIGLLAGNTFVIKILTGRSENGLRIFHNLFPGGLSMRVETHQLMGSLSDVINKQNRLLNKRKDSDDNRLISGEPNIELSGLNGDLDNIQNDMLGIAKFVQIFHLQFHHKFYFCTLMAQTEDGRFKKREASDISKRFIPILGKILEYPNGLYFLHGTNYWKDFIDVICSAVNIDAETFKVKLKNFVNCVLQVCPLYNDVGRSDMKNLFEALKNVPTTVTHSGTEYTLSPNNRSYIGVLLRIKAIGKEMLIVISKLFNQNGDEGELSELIDKSQDHYKELVSCPHASKMISFIYPDFQSDDE